MINKEDGLLKILERKISSFFFVFALVNYSFLRVVSPLNEKLEMEGIFSGELL